MDIRPVGYVIFDFQSVGADLELVARRHHPSGPEDLDVEQADRADVLGLVGDIVDGKLDPGLVFDLVGDVDGGEFNLTGNVVGSKFGHLSANGNGKEKETIVSALARNSDTSGGIAVGMRTLAVVVDRLLYALELPSRNRFSYRLWCRPVSRERSSQCGGRAWLVLCIELIWACTA